MTRPILAVFAAVVLGATAPDPVAWKLEEIPARPLKVGARFNLKLVARIQEGWHLYSLKPMVEGPIPTRIWLPEGQPFSLAAAVQAPEPETKHDPSFNMEVELYEGETAFTLPLRIAAGAPPGAQTVVVNASFQTCNNKICLPPRTVKVEAPVVVVK
jgi:thiol:disulfide interchange protein DsbD